MRAVVTERKEECASWYAKERVREIGGVQERMVRWFSFFLLFAALLSFCSWRILRSRRFFRLYQAHILAPLERWAAGVTSERVAASAASWAASTTATYAPSGPRSSDASGSSIRDTTTESTSSSSSTNHRDSDSRLLEASPSASSFFMRGDSSRVFDVFFHVYSLPAVLDNKRAKVGYAL